VNLADAVRRAEPALKVTLPAFPAPATVDGVEFIEFATSQSEAPALERLLAALGFACTGAHVSKPVRLWRQGGINILVNTATEGFAHTAFVAHGTCVSEIALRVPDAAAAAARACALLVAPQDQTAAPGELDIPAIRGAGGSLIRFVDPGLSRLWEVDFRTTPAPAGAGLTRVDHIAQTMPHDEMLSWSLFYTALFSAEKAPMVDVADPDGLVKSQAIRSGGLRVTLNGAEARRTLAGRFIEDGLGSAVQHIAFATDDIFATADRLAANGFATLQIGGNYYRDVEARFGLPPDLVARMKAAGILYDEDAGGAFFQLYGTSRPQGFFVEIVQRNPGYQGYGAPNAPFRIAAQKRAARPADMPLR
jgi:4-hydroxyphenylpyruvate dioxygenase